MAFAINSTNVISIRLDPMEVMAIRNTDKIKVIKVPADGMQMEEESHTVLMPTEVIINNNHKIS